MRRLLRYLSILFFIGMACTVLVGIFILFSPDVFQAALKVVDRHLPIIVTVEHYRHRPGSIELEGVSVSTSAGHLADVPLVRIKYNLFALVRGRVELDLVELDEPSVQIIRRTDGASTIDWLYDSAAHVPRRPAGAEEPEGAVTPAQSGVHRLLKHWIPASTGMTGRFHQSIFSRLVPIYAKEVSINDASVRYYQEKGNRSMELDSLDLHGSFSSSPLHAEIAMEEGILRLGTTLREQGRVQGSIDITNDTIWIDSLSLAYPKSMIHGKGYYSLQSRVFQGDLDIEHLPVGEILETLEIASLRIDWTSGTIHLKGQGLARGTLNGDLEGYGYGQGFHAGLDAGFGKEALTVSDMVVGADEGTITGSGTWDYRMDRLDGTVSLEASTCSKALQELGVPGTSLENLVVLTRLEGSSHKPQAIFNASAVRASFHGLSLQGIKFQGNFTEENGLVANATVERIPVAGTWDSGWTVDARYKEGSIEAGLHGPPGLNLRVSLNKEADISEAQILVRKLDVSPLLSTFLGESCTAFVTAEGKARGHYAHLFATGKGAAWRDMEGDLNITQLFLHDKDLTITNDKPFTFTAKNRRLRWDASLQVDSGGIRLNGSAPLGEGKGDIEVITSASLDLKPLNGALVRFLPELSTLQGRLHCEGRVFGPIDFLKTEGSITLDSGMVVLCNRARAQAHQEEEILRGNVQLKAKISGPVKAPSGSMMLSVDKGTLYHIPITSFTAAASSDGNKVSLTRADLVTQGGRLAVQGSLELDNGTISGVLSSSRVDLAQALVRPDVHLQGAMYLNGSLGGTVKEPQLSLKMPVQDLKWDETPLGNVDTTINLTSDVVSLEAGLTSGTVHGTMTLNSGYPFSLEATVKKMPLHPFFLLAGLTDFQGEITVRGNLQGTASHLELLTGEILCDQILMTKGERRLINTTPVVIHIKGGEGLMDHADLRLNDLPFSVEGALWKTLDLAVNGSLPLEPTDELFPWMKVASGSAQVDARIQGSPRSPKVYGHTDLTATHVVLQYYPYPIDSVAGSIKLDGNRIEVISLTGQVAEGTVTASGAVSWAPLSFDRCRLDATSIPYRIPDTLEARWGGVLSLNGNAGASTLQGKVRIDDARYYKDFELTGELLGLRRPTLSPPRTYSDLLQNMGLSVHIESGPDLVVKNNIARISLSMNLDLTGTIANPVPQGLVKVLEGRVYYSEKQFDITVGYLEYPGEAGTQPILHLSSRVQVRGETRDYEVFLDLDGPLDRITLSLRSIPDLEREDIIFVLLTGQTQSEYFSSPSSGMGGTTKQLAFTGLSSLIGGNVKSWTSLDTFLMEGSKGKALGVKTIVGKRINERMDVRGTLNLGSGKAINEAQVEYRLTDTLYLVGTQRSDGTFGLDFRFRYQGD